MKALFIKISLVLSLVTCVGTLVAQPPPSVPFQVVAKDAMGNPAKNRTIYVKNIIRQGGPQTTAPIVWEESHITTSDNDGIYTIYIGKGTPTAAFAGSDISKIDWGNGPFFFNFKAAISPSIPSPWWLPADNYVDYGTSQMLSVPYALFAGNASVTNVNTSIAPGKPNTFLITDSLGNVNWAEPQAAQQNVTQISNYQLQLVVTPGTNATIPANGTVKVDIPIPDADLGDPVVITALGDYQNFTVYSAWVSAKGVVSVRFANYQARAIPVSGNLYKIVIIK
jgi:hypothetical protein